MLQGTPFHAKHFDSNHDMNEAAKKKQKSASNRLGSLHQDNDLKSIHHEFVHKRNKKRIRTKYTKLLHWSTVLCTVVKRIRVKPC